jgi:hypothetical protein
MYAQQRSKTLRPLRYASDKLPLQPRIAIEQQQKPRHAVRTLRYLPMRRCIALRLARGYGIGQGICLSQRAQQPLARHCIHRS